MRNRAPLILLAGILIAVAGLVVVVTRPTTESLLRDADAAIRAEDYDRAIELADKSLQLQPDSVPAMMVRAMVAERVLDPTAMEFYDRIPDSAGQAAVEARVRAGVLRLDLTHQSGLAEEQFRRALAIDPDNRRAHDRLAYLLGISGRPWEMIPHQLAMLRLGDANPTRLYALSLGDRLPTEPGVICRFADRAPEDPLVLAGQSLIASAENRPGDAINELRLAIEHDPSLTALRVRLGQLLLETGGDSELPAWHNALPASAEEYPLLWVIRGQHASRTGQTRAAMRCFWEAVLRDPNQQQANYQLGRLLTADARPDDAAPFLERAQRLEEYVRAVFVSTFADVRNPDTLVGYQQCAKQADALGLDWEAWAWRQLAQQRQRRNPLMPAPDNPRPEATLTARCRPDANPARLIDLSEEPLPEWKSPSRSSGTMLATRITIADRAAELGIDFRYLDASDARTEGKRIFDSIGGGVAVLDLDRDGWPDLYATQRCAWPPAAADTSSVDAMFRNRGGSGFQEIAGTAGISENGYSQGVTIGDYNSDGFPDLYVANIGGNRFYANNGDGTFSDVTDETGTAGEGWSTSCVLADLNGDAHPDLYAAGYVDLSDDPERVCRGPDGALTTCPPGSFGVARHRLYLNRGDGDFDDISDAAGINTGAGRGLGVVAADVDGSGRLSLFVANDQDPNCMWVHDPAAEEGALQYVDRALSGGLAMSGDGRAQACMGVAAGDANGDGRIDLFVTNFTEESNTLYLGAGDGLFADETSYANLASVSRPMLGFGTQFHDADLDGRLDLMVANGHIDDRSGRGEAYRMPPQLFRNGSDGRFTLVEATSLGPYFEGSYLGRAVARIDWNRDGLDDLAVAHLDAPLALLTNTSPEHGHGLTLQLTGTRSSRDAIGARVVVTAGSLTSTHQLTAGDGFHASNERVLTIGLGKQEQVDELRVIWPSGEEQSFSGLAPGERYLIVEGRARALPDDSDSARNW